MRDRLRALRDRPLRDADRRWLFAIVAGLLVVVAIGLVALDDASTEAEPTAPRAPAPTVVTYVPADAPSEESHPNTQPSASDIAGSKRAARRFLAAYLPLTYGHGSARRLPATTPELRELLTREPPRIPPGQQGRRPRVELLQSNGVNHQHAALVALVDDDQRRYSVHLELANTHDGWLVIALGG